MNQCARTICLIIVTASVFSGAKSSRANVYATHIEFNGSLSNSYVAPGYPVQISYTLNQPATSGVQAKILSGAQVVRAFTFLSGQPGALRGSNSVIWDGKDADGNAVAPGAYSLSIIAGATGFSDWTNISDESTNYAVFYPRGIDVNKNTNSVDYGRVFIANALAGSPTNDIFSQLGILKYNADGSPADEGQFSSGGYPWGTLYSPWKIAIGADDLVYINDWDGAGAIVQFDEAISTNWNVVLDANNFPTNDPTHFFDMSGPFVTGPAGAEQIWMTDINTNSGPSDGVVVWSLAGLLATNDFGTVAVTETNWNLSFSPDDVAVGPDGSIYVTQRTDEADDPNNRVFRFAPLTNPLKPATNAVWAVGANDTNLVYADGVAVDPTGAMVAVACRGNGEDPENLFAGNVSILHAADGSVLTRLCPTNNNQFTDVAWDNVGNLYALDYTATMWRVFSPPGANQATTAAVSTIQAYSALTAPRLENPFVATNGDFEFTLEGQADVTYIIELSTNLTDWCDVATNYSTAADRQLSFEPTGDTQDFYRAFIDR